MHGKRVLITGANSGIGRAAAVELARQGARVVLIARDEGRGGEALDEVSRVGEASLHLADFGVLSEVRALAAELLEAYERIDVLVNNAGLVLSERRESVDGHEMTLQVNHLAPFLLTSLLLDRLRSSAPARIVNVSSDAHKRGGALDLDDLDSRRRYSGFRVYGRTKLMNLLFTRSLARRLEGSGVTVNALHPGVVATGFTQGGDTSGVLQLGWRLMRPFLRDPARGAETIVFLAGAPEVEGVTGKYFYDCEARRPNAQAEDDDVAERLWTLSEARVGLT